MAEAVVIGAGQNGLAAAIRLAGAGLSVTVLEAADAPGGAVRTQELTLPGFLHDAYSAVYPASVASPVFAAMPLHRHGLEWVHPAACVAHTLTPERSAVLYRDLGATAASLNDLRPGDGDRWVDFVQPFVDAWDAVRATMLSGFPPVGGPLKLLAQAGPAQSLRFASLLVGSSDALGRDLFEGQDARAWLNSAATHGDTPPNGRGSAIAAFYLNLMGHTVGWPSPRGGSERITDALVSHLAELGGSVRTGARVVKVHSRDRRVTGVELAGGERVPAALVIADVMPHALAEMAGDGLPLRYRRALRRYVYGPATLKVDWALDGPIPWSDPEVRGAGTVHVAGTQTEFLTTVRQSQHGLPEKPFLLLGQQSVADPTRAPAGRHTAWAYTHGPSRGVDWAAAEPFHVARMEAQIERFAPGFSERVLARNVAGPAALERDDANLVHGDVGGGSYRLSQVVFRPTVGLSPYRTPLRGLFLGSAAAFPGGAVHGVPGDAAARAALRRWP
jgi:phytoene dehydrogenase-like protein